MDIFFYLQYRFLTELTNVKLFLKAQFVINCLFLYNSAAFQSTEFNIW